MNQELILKDEVYAIVGAAIEVHRHLKSGYLEAIYQEAMEIELRARGIPFIAQSQIQVFYKDAPLRMQYVADLVCHGQILVELKVLERLSGKEEAQLLNYLNATRMKVGLLINFGDIGRLDWHRFVLWSPLSVP
jgi:GxxExxY protein